MTLRPRWFHLGGNGVLRADSEAVDPDGIGGPVCDRRVRIGSDGPRLHRVSGAVARRGRGARRRECTGRYRSVGVRGCTKGRRLRSEHGRLLDGSEPVGEVRSVFQGLEPGLREGVVVGDVGARVGLVEIGAQQRDRLGLHRGAAVGAQELLGRVAGGADPAQERANRRGMPTFGEAFDDYLAANPTRKASTEALYRGQMRYCLGDWLSRPLDTITRRDVEARFHRISERHGWAVGNHATSLLRSVYRRPCVDFEGLRKPVELWLAGGGRYNRTVRRASGPRRSCCRAGARASKPRCWFRRRGTSSGWGCTPACAGARS